MGPRGRARCRREPRAPRRVAAVRRGRWRSERKRRRGRGRPGPRGLGRAQVSAAGGRGFPGGAAPSLPPAAPLPRQTRARSHRRFPRRRAEAGAHPGDSRPLVRQRGLPAGTALRGERGRPGHGQRPDEEGERAGPAATARPPALDPRGTWERGWAALGQGA